MDNGKTLEKLVVDMLLKITVVGILFSISTSVMADCKDDIYNLQLKVKHYQENEQWSSACMVSRDSERVSNKCDISYDLKTKLRALTFDICNKAEKLGNKSQGRVIAY